MSESELDQKDTQGVSRRPRAGLNELEKGVVEWFSDGVKVLGLPPSLGEIYGLLFISKEALSLDDLVRALEISKGSASQGLNWLRELGAVRLEMKEGVRRSYYRVDVELKQLAAGFLRSQIHPHLKRGTERLEVLEQYANIEEEEKRAFYRSRIDKMEQWLKRGKLVLPILQKVLGG